MDDYEESFMEEHGRLRILEPTCSVGPIEAMESGTVTTVKAKGQMGTRMVIVQN